MRLRYALVIALAAADCLPTAAPVAAAGTYRRRLDEAGCLTDIAGYAPATDVDQHAYIDLDMEEMITYLETPVPVPTPAPVAAPADTYRRLQTTEPDYTNAIDICASCFAPTLPPPPSFSPADRARFPDLPRRFARRRERRQLDQGHGLPHAPGLRAEGPYR